MRSSMTVCLLILHTQCMRSCMMVCMRSSMTVCLLIYTHSALCVRSSMTVCLLIYKETVLSRSKCING